MEDSGKEIALALQIPYMAHIVLKRSFSATQTLKARLSRWGDIEESFVLADPEEIEGKHVLLVDDLITTGATVDPCSKAVKLAAGVKISVATMPNSG